jgi:hypothetical protein
MLGDGPSLLTTTYRPPNSGRYVSCSHGFAPLALPALPDRAKRPVPVAKRAPFWSRTRPRPSRYVRPGQRDRCRPLWTALLKR